MEWATVSRLSDHMEETREGYLVVRDVVLARTGVQIYHVTEVPPLLGDERGLVHLDRPADEVFKPESVQTYVGKPITDDHPPGFVNPDNYDQLSVGYVWNPRRGTGDDADLLLGDMLFNVRRGINAVRGGKRGVSVGYQAKYSQNAPGSGWQYDIFCNHIALVDDARCGERCTIKDGRLIYDHAHAEAYLASLAHDHACGCDECRARAAQEIGTMAKFKLTDYLQKAFLAKDKTALEQLITDAEAAHKEPDGDEGQGAGNSGGVHVHIAHGGEGDAKDNDETEKRLAACEDGIKAMDGKLTTLIDSVSKLVKDNGDNGNGDKKDDADKKDDKETKDAEGEEGAQSAEALASAEPDLMEADPALKTGRSQMGDSKYVAVIDSAMTKLLQDVAARAEVLSPGMQLPVLDGKSKDRFKSVGNTICDVRRSALIGAAGNDKGKAALGRYTTDAIKTMSCAEVRMLFHDASDRMRAANNASMMTAYPVNFAAAGGPMAQHFQTANQQQRSRLAGINKANREFWAKQQGLPN